MADWSWKQAVAQCVLEIVNRRRSAEFTLHDVYRYTDALSRQFPRNKNVQPKIRQVLQRLRKDAFVVFQGEGNYALNFDFDELDAEPAALRHEGVRLPQTKRVFRNIRLRSTFLPRNIKLRYGNLCQVCRIPVSLREQTYYAEAHHLKSLGAPHFGPDVAGNIIVLCPNHHVMFDKGAATIVPETLKLGHHVAGVFPRNARVHVEPWHKLNHKYVRYHHFQVFARSVPGGTRKTR